MFCPAIRSHPRLRSLAATRQPLVSYGEAPCSTGFHRQRTTDSLDPKQRLKDRSPQQEIREAMERQQ